MTTRALILAAGRGSRMKGLTDERPKCLVELQGRPLLAYQVAALRAGGASEIGIVRGYRAEAIQVPGATYFQNERWSSTNMVMSLAVAAEWLKAGPGLISYSDIFYSHKLVRLMVEAAGDLVVAYDDDWLDLWRRRFPDPLSDAETFRLDASGRLTEIGSRASHIDEIEGQYMGLLKFTPRAWRDVEAVLGGLDGAAQDRLDMTSLLRRLITAGTPISTVATRGQWGEVDSESDLMVYEKMISRGELALDSN